MKLYGPPTDGRIKLYLQKMEIMTIHGRIGKLYFKKWKL